ncbi:hypothetical protein ET445_14530 [Agromyces protaetiae]|uniref:Uncharacterized protein n=1 Tax=Agromyces protaetiae TaxID=2509455 RepID=A0A4P6FGU4_9MICO|nr:hypothetical protein [Agromyces protaetiae]QAY74363.1 hypothetical protein ET445_14530 [Agromyces protaetiae]
MPAPRRKPLLVWEPLPYLVIVVLLLCTGFVRPSSPPWLQWPLFVLIGATIVWILFGISRERRRSNPDQWGALFTLEGLEVIDADPVDRSVRTVVPVADTNRHQAAIEIARVHGGAELHAVLVPRASRWMSRRYRMGVQLVAEGDRPRHAGYLRDDAEARWVDLLDGLRLHGSFVRVPAFVTGAARPFGVELDLSGLERLEDANSAGAEASGDASN